MLLTPRGVDLDLGAGKTLELIGETGSCKPDDDLPELCAGVFLGICLSDPNRRCPSITYAALQSLQLFKDLLQDCRKLSGIMFPKCIGLITVDIKNSNQVTLSIVHRDH